MVDLSSLADLPSEMGAWQPLTPEALSGRSMTISAWDQSLAASAHVLVYREGTYVEVIKSVTFKPPDMREVGFVEDYMKALWLEDRMAEDLEPLFRPGLPGNIAITHETPPVINKRTLVKIGPRAGVPSRMAGQSLWSAAHRFGAIGCIQMVNSQTAKKNVCGNHKAEKKEAHDALKQLTWIHGLDQVTNEHERDGILLALKILKENSDG